MQTKKNITPFNEKGEHHGYWEVYYNNYWLAYKGTYVNGIRHGFWEQRYIGGETYLKGNYVNGEKVGIWFEYGKELFYAN